MSDGGILPFAHASNMRQASGIIWPSKYAPSEYCLLPIFSYFCDATISVRPYGQADLNVTCSYEMDRAEGNQSGPIISFAGHFIQTMKLLYVVPSWKDDTFVALRVAQRVWNDTCDHV